MAQSKPVGKADSEQDADMSGDLESEIKLNGRVIPLKSIKLREAFAALTKLEMEIEGLKSSGSDNTKLI